MTRHRAKKWGFLIFLFFAWILCAKFPLFLDPDCPTGALCPAAMVRNPSPFMFAGLVFMAYASWFIVSMNSLSRKHKILLSFVLFIFMAYVFLEPLRQYWLEWVASG